MTDSRALLGVFKFSRTVVDDDGVVDGVATSVSSRRRRVELAPEQRQQAAVIRVSWMSATMAPTPKKERKRNAMKPASRPWTTRPQQGLRRSFPTAPDVVGGERRRDR
jgi:hypothetical protein